MNKIKKIISGNTFGIISPASYENPNKIENNINKFKNLGFNLITSEHLFNQYGYLSDTDSNRANDLMNMFLDNRVDGIICYRGGFGSIRILDLLDYTLIKNNPKVFCGYSDITILLNTISNKCKFPCFHSPMINSNFSDAITNNYFLDSVSGRIKSYNLNHFTNIEILNAKNFCGTLSGGNLSIICSSLGTPYEVKFNNRILLLEDIGEEPYAIDRMLSQLILSKKLSSCSGIILGHFTDCKSKNDYSFTIRDLIKEKLEPLKIPIICNFPSGHSYPNITLPIGAKLEFSKFKNQISIVDRFFL